MHAFWFQERAEIPAVDFLARALIDLARTERIFLAESCTGGQACAALSRVPGASAVWLGGVVAYDNSLKTRLLGVDSALIAREGAVSREVALAMADGGRDLYGATLSAAVTGVAGPGGATPGKPVGCVWVALRHGEKRWVQKFLLPQAGRHAIQEETVRRVLLAMIQVLTSGVPQGFQPACPVEGPPPA